MKKLVVGRRVPDFPDNDEPKTPRLCVCRCVPACLAARLFPSRKLFVYRTVRPMKGVTPMQVWDAPLTSETWLIPPAELDLVDEITQEEAVLCQDKIRHFHMMTGANSTLGLRVAQLLIAWKVLGDRFPHHGERQFAERVAKELGIGDPERYILKKAKRELSGGSK